MAFRLDPYFKDLRHCKIRLCFTLLTWLALSACASCAITRDDDETNYVNLLLKDLDNGGAPDQQPDRFLDGKDIVKRHWGISDATAVAGKVFSYPIPDDAFTGKIKRYEVTEAGESKLPEWLLYDEDSQTFSGVPLAKDIGQYYISVKALGYSQSKAPAAKDVFSIEVVSDSSDGRFGDGEASSGYCSNGESYTLATLVIDLNIDELNISERIGVLKKLSAFLNLGVKKLKLLPKTEKNSVDLNAVYAGPGNTNRPSKNGGVIEWKVTCSSSISNEQKVMITKLERAAEDGSLANSLEYPIIGWHISNVFPKVMHRDKRQIVRGTPVPGVMPTQWPKFTERVEEFEVTEDTLTPETRIIPTMASPVLMQPSHHHRHGHGEAFERGHHPHRMLVESPVLFTSPTLYNHQMHTPIGGTPVIVPDRPTKYIPATPVVDDPFPSRYYPEEHTPIVGLVSSMIVPTPSTGETEALPTQTFISSIEVESSEIKPTKTHTVVEKTQKPPGTPNFKPTIEKRIQKLLMVAGKIWKYQIPHDTFVDMEDGDTRHLKLLFMTSDRTAVSPNSWIQFDPEKQMLYALPLDEHIGKYEFILEAMDNEGATTNDRLDIHVWQHQSARAKHHEFSVSLKYNKWQYPITIDWNIEFAKRLSKYFRDRNESNIAVQSVVTEPVTTFTWSNDSLPPYPCPNEGIADLTNKLIDENTNEISPAFRKAMGSDFNIIDVSVNFLGVCHTTASTTPSTQFNFPPMLRNPIERINTTVGEILRFKIPDDTFYDYEDGSTRYLALTFLTIENIHPPKSSWVQFDHKSQELYGLPFDGDSGRHEFQLVAMDNNGLQINDVFVIEVHARPPKKWNVEFSLHIDHDYEEFSKDISKKVLVAWKLAKLYDDPDPRYLTVSSISKGSVVYAWTNNTLPHDPCPKRIIDKLVKNMINEDGTISAKLTEAMLPEFKIIKADAMPLGICLGEVTPTSVTIAPPPATQRAEPAATSDDDIYITTIIPAVVIAVMLIIAALVACFLYRRKRKGKMTMTDHNTFIGNRAPVIFGDEMEEKPDPAKPPVIMKEEKPPLAPPDYLRSSVSSRDSTPHLDRVEQANLRNTNADLHVDPSPLFQPPPPPFTNNRDSKNSRNKGTPTYRQPPPYVMPVPP